MEAIKTINQHELLPPNKGASLVHTNKSSVSVVTFAVVSGVTLGIEWLRYILRGKNVAGDDAAVFVTTNICEGDGSSDEGVLTSKVLKDDVFRASSNCDITRAVSSKLSSVDSSSSRVLEWVWLVVFVDFSKRVEFITNIIASGAISDDSELVDCDRDDCAGRGSEATSVKDGLARELSELEFS